MFQACPARPKPVTSVTAVAPWRWARREPSALERSISTSAGSRPAASIRSNLKAFTSAPLPSGLVEYQAVAGARSLVGEQAVRVAVADHRQPELELLVADRVPAEDRGASRVAGCRAAGEDLSQNLRWRVGREAAQVEREERPSSHGVDVGDGVGRGDPPEPERIVTDRRDEVGRGDERLAAEEHHTGVVEGLGSDQHARSGLGELDDPVLQFGTSEHCAQIAGTDLCCTAAGGGGLREAIAG